MVLLDCDVHYWNGGVHAIPGGWSVLAKVDTLMSLIMPRQGSFKVHFDNSNHRILSLTARIVIGFLSAIDSTVEPIELDIQQPPLSA